VLSIGNFDIFFRCDWFSYFNKSYWCPPVK